MERGATWIKQWDDRITHIIVDKSLSFSDILKFLKMSSIPVRKTYSTVFDLLMISVHYDPC